VLPEVIRAFRDELQKIAVTRSVKEWRAAQGAGDAGTAGQIAGASHQLGLKPRYLKDISTGGEEAGVDLMMGHKAGPTGETNEGGLLARKLYKPDSLVSQGEFTPQLLKQKQTAVDTARALSPEAKAMVPAMYGHETSGAGTPTQRTTSFHEYVPGMHDLRDLPRDQRSAALTGVKSNVLDPMANKGMTMGDTISNRTGGGHGANWGNVVGSPQGPKVLDFLPGMGGESNPAIESMKKYAPIHGPSKFNEGPMANLGSLRKEVFKPTMQSNEAPYMDRVQAHMAVGAAPPSPPTGQTPAGRLSGWVPTAHAPAAAGGEMRTSPATPRARPAAPINVLGAHPDPFPASGTAGLLHGAGSATKNFFGRAAGHL
jgi:hypothetical protein